MILRTEADPNLMRKVNLCTEADPNLMRKVNLCMESDHNLMGKANLCTEADPKKKNQIASARNRSASLKPEKNSSCLHLTLVCAKI